MSKTIEFVNNAGKAPDPINKTRELSFRDLTFKDEYKTRVTKFTQGLTWLRFLPAIKGSVYDWMMPLEIHQDVGGVTFVSPKTFDSNALSAFDIARIWFQRNNRAVLASKDTNPNGFRLYPKRAGISWVVEEAAPEGERLKLFYRSLYDGTRGGSTGLAYNVRREADARDNEPGSPTAGELIHGDITDPNAGRQVKIERSLGEKSEYANYKVGIGKNTAKIEHFLAQLTDDESNLIIPLERTLHIPSDEEVKDILRRYIGDGFYREIFTESGPKSSGWNPTPKKAEVTSEKYEDEDVAVNRSAIAVSEDDEDVEIEVSPTRVKSKKTVGGKTTGSSGVSSHSNGDSDEDLDHGNAQVTHYTTKEVTNLLAKEKAGVQELLKNRTRLSKTLLDIVLDSAKEYGLDA